MRHHEVEISFGIGLILIVLQSFNLIKLPLYIFLITFLWWLIPIFGVSLYVFFYTYILIKRRERFEKRWKKMNN